MGLLRIKALSLVLLFLIFLSFSSSSGIADGNAMHGTSPSLSKNEKVVEEAGMNHRKLMSASMLDYGDAGPNPKHDPRKRGPGGRP